MYTTHTSTHVHYTHQHTCTLHTHQHTCTLHTPAHMYTTHTSTHVHYTHQHTCTLHTPAHMYTTHTSTHVHYTYKIFEDRGQHSLWHASYFARYFLYSVQSYQYKFTLYWLLGNIENKCLLYITPANIHQHTYTSTHAPAHMHTTHTSTHIHYTHQHICTLYTPAHMYTTHTSTQKYLKIEANNWHCFSSLWHALYFAKYFLCSARSYQYTCQVYWLLGLLYITPEYMYTTHTSTQKHK